MSQPDMAVGNALGVVCVLRWDSRFCLEVNLYAVLQTPGLHQYCLPHSFSGVWDVSGAAVPSFGQSRAPPSRSSSFGSDAGGGPGAFYPAQAPSTPGGPRPAGRAPAFGGQGGFSQPGGAGTQLAPSYGPPQSQAVLDQFEALTLGPAAPGQPGDTGMPFLCLLPKLRCCLIRFIAAAITSIAVIHGRVCHHMFLAVHCTVCEQACRSHQNCCNKLGMAFGLSCRSGVRTMWWGGSLYAYTCNLLVIDGKQTNLAETVFSAAAFRCQSSTQRHSLVLILSMTVLMGFCQCHLLEHILMMDLPNGLVRATCWTDPVEASAEVDMWRAGIDLAAFPRPTGEAAEAAVAAPAPIFPANANPRYLRLTCNAIPAQQVRPFYPSKSLTIFDHAPLVNHIKIHFVP